MIRKVPQGTFPNITYPRLLKTYRMVSMGRMGFGEVELLGKQESIIVALLETERGTNSAVNKHRGGC